MDKPVLSRAEAKTQGLSRYFTGKSCKYGHIAERIVANGVCVVCAYEIEKRYKKAHPEKLKKKWRNYERNASEERRVQHHAANKKYAAANREEIDERINRWKAANPDKVATYSKNWRENNRDKHLAKIKKWHAAHRNSLEYKQSNIDRVKQWAQNNPDRNRAIKKLIAHRRRARIYQVGGSYTQTEIDALFELQNSRCGNPHCSTELTVENRELDHIIAISKGGPNHIGNLQWLCTKCNRWKNDKDWHEFLAEYVATQGTP